MTLKASQRDQFSEIEDLACESNQRPEDKQSRKGGLRRRGLFHKVLLSTVKYSSESSVKVFEYGIDSQVSLASLVSSAQWQ